MSSCKQRQTEKINRLNVPQHGHASCETRKFQANKQQFLRLLKQKKKELTVPFGIKSTIKKKRISKTNSHLWQLQFELGCIHVAFTSVILLIKFVGYMFINRIHVHGSGDDTDLWQQSEKTNSKTCFF